MIYVRKELHVSVSPLDNLSNFSLIYAKFSTSIEKSVLLLMVQTVLESNLWFVTYK